jgi:hypothetical protein
MVTDGVGIVIYLGVSATGSCISGLGNIEGWGPSIVTDGTGMGICIGIGVGVD